MSMIHRIVRIYNFRAEQSLRLRSVASVLHEIDFGRWTAELEDG